MAQSGTISLDQSLPVTLGQTITFTTTYEGLKKDQQPQIQITGFQNGVEVYHNSQFPTPPWILGDGSLWAQNGGPAHCIAILYYWDYHPHGQQVILASLEFDANG